MNPGRKFDDVDVLVIGAGLAGFSAAWSAAKNGLKVIIITGQEKVTESSSYYAQGGIIYKAANDDFKTFYNDFNKAGAGYVNEKAVSEIFSNVQEFIDEILVKEIQVPFDKTDDDQISLTKEAAHSRARIAHVKDQTGKAIQEHFHQKISLHPNITIINKATATDLITLAHHSVEETHIYEPSTCVGAYVLFQDTGQVYPILSKYTILATGGLGRVYLHTSNPVTARGDGYAMAYRAGARIMNMEYTQFHPTTLFSADEERFLITEAIRGEGGVLRNINGDEFMKNYHEMGDLAPRDIVSRSIIKELSRTNSHFVYLDISHKNSQWTKERFPMIYQKCMEKKIDITTSGIPVVPAAHYECGGIFINKVGDTTINRLKAVGETACTGLHGANRLASSSLAECLVYGTSAGIDCFNNIKNTKFIIPKVESWKSENESVDPDLLWQDYLTIRQTMWNYCGIVRTKKKLDRAYYILKKLEKDIVHFYSHSKLSDDLIGLRNSALASILVIHASKLNKQSKGCHYRID